MRKKKENWLDTEHDIHPVLTQDYPNSTFILW